MYYLIYTHSTPESYYLKEEIKAQKGQELVCIGAIRACGLNR